MSKRIVCVIAFQSLFTGGGSAQTVADAKVGLLGVRQFGSTNAREDLSALIDNGALTFSAPDANRGDFGVGFGSGDDLRRGVMLVSPRNGTRSNTTAGNAGGNAGGDLYATLAAQRPASTADLIVSGFGAPSGSEMNIDASAVFFPFAAGFIAGHALNSVNNGPIDTLIASPGIGIGSTFFDQTATDGVYTLDLSHSSANGSNGVLLVCGGKNEDNFALSRHVKGGLYEIRCKDNGADDAALENDPVAFVYLPYATPGLFAGSVSQSSNAASLISGTGGVSVASLGAGRVRVRIVGVTTGDQGAFLVSPESQGAAQDNIVTAEWSDAEGGFIVESRDIPSMAIEDVGGLMFGFAYIPVTQGEPIEPSPGASTLIVLPDTQFYARDNAAIFHAQTQWIADEAQSRNIRMVMHVGDITNDNDPPQWSVARAAMDRIHLGVPYHLAQGNHDVGPSGDASSRSTLMNTYFPASHLAQQPTWGGSTNNSQIENAYSLFEAGGRKWIVVSLEWGPRDSALAWADGVLSAYQDRLAIVVTHAYMFDDDTRMDHTVASYQGSPYTYGTASLPGGTNDGGDIWRELVRFHPNIAFVFSGHITGEGRLSSVGDHGNTVHQILTDFQARLEGGGGCLRIIELFPGSDRVLFRTYSPWTGGSITGTGSHFELDIEAAEGFEGWVCARGDVNGDGQLSPADFSACIGRFNLAAPGCDQNQDGLCTPADFSAWIAAFQRGCD